MKTIKSEFKANMAQSQKMEGTQLFPHVKVHGDTFSIDAENFAESWPESRDLEESDIIQQLAKLTPSLSVTSLIPPFSVETSSYRCFRQWLAD
jgi:hypothetical protein